MQGHRRDFDAPSRRKMLTYAIEPFSLSFCIFAVEEYPKIRMEKTWTNVITDSVQSALNGPEFLS